MPDPNLVYAKVKCKNCGKEYFKRKKTNTNYSRRTGHIRGSNSVTCSKICSREWSRKRFRKSVKHLNTKDIKK